MSLHQHLSRLTLVCALAFTAATAAQASTINAATPTFTGSVITFDGFDEFSTTGPLDLGGGVTFTSTPFARVGANAQDLQDNGLWTNFAGLAQHDGNFLASSFVANRGEFGFAFANPVAQVGAFVNQFQALGQTSNSLLLIAYNQSGDVLEEARVTIDTDAFGYDEGRFVGFSRASADIYGFGIANGTFVMDNLTFTTAVPEPGALALVVAGLGALGAARRRRA